LDCTKTIIKQKIIGKSATHFWKEQIMELGGEYPIWSNAPENFT
jgi:putative transcriptional regulator